MLKKVFLPIFFSFILGSLSSCNSSDDSSYTYDESSSVIVSAFSLKDNEEILDSLQNVFFSIDLVDAKIFNADSLPYGTKVDRLIPSITTSSVASAVELSFYDTKLEKDSVVNYLTNSSDSIDFSHGPVKLTVTSQSGTVKREYEIRVNVHQVKADSLAWYKIETASLPTDFSTIQAQYTANLGETYYCLTTDGTQYCLATTTNPADPQWKIEVVNLDFRANVESLRASNDALYILDLDGNLYSSTDAKIWSATGQVWHYIYGGYENEIMGSENTQDGYVIRSYPSLQSWHMPSDFPIEGTSATWTYSLNMGYTPQLVMVGGRLSNGVLTRSTWSFDGENWADVSVRPLPLALEYITMAPYHMIEVLSTTWSPQTFPVLFAMGGRNAQGLINRTIYYSRDWGMSWDETPELMQLPEGFPSLYGASGFEFSTTMYVDSRSADWTTVNIRKLPPHYQFLGLPNTSSRAIKPITEWQCPALYLFGGRNYDGETQNMLWRGVILNFTFKPVQ